MLWFVLQEETPINAKFQRPRSLFYTFNVPFNNIVKSLGA